MIDHVLNRSVKISELLKLLLLSGLPVQPAVYSVALLNQGLATLPWSQAGSTHTSHTDHRTTLDLSICKQHGHHPGGLEGTVLAIQYYCKLTIHTCTQHSNLMIQAEQRPEQESLCQALGTPH